MTPTAAVPFTELLHAYVRKERDSRNGQRFARNGWSMSGTGSCHRKRVLERAGATKSDLRGESLLVFAYGDIAEDVARAALNAGLKGELFWQVPVSMPKWNAAGTLDLLHHAPDGEWDLWDVKSASGKSFEWAVKDGGRKENKMQLTAYAASLEFGTIRYDLWPTERTPLPVGPIKIRRAGLLMFDKEYGYSTVLPVSVDEWLPEVNEDYATLNAEWDRHVDTLPPEIPFQEIKSSQNKHVKAGRARKGDMAPSGLCSPLYCNYIHHCPIIAGWWKGERKGKPNVEPDIDWQDLPPGGSPNS